MIEGLVNSIIDWADNFGLVGLAVVSMTEAIIQPAPPDLLVIPMAISSNGSLSGITAIVLVATIFSVIGSLGGYAIGMYAGRPLLEKFVNAKNLSRLDYIFKKYGSIGIFIAAVSPIPYKAFAWAAGSSKMNLRLFIAAGILGRGLRFGLEGFILGLWGNEFLKLLENPFFWLFGGIILTCLFIPLNNWWESIIITSNKDV
ncbi:MAG: YqaA family protein [Candidatus Poseidoniales archaeon]|jgi:undecaprenyl-diphosphatase|tara:strand:- start:10186 stop:10788 length:603 start_codon:yes stop_codon:yes gene_type:complete